MKRPLAITSPNHAMAIAVYFILGLMGALIALGSSNSSTINRAIGNDGTDIWATTLAMAGFMACYAALRSTKARRPEAYLRLEMWSTFALFTNLTFYMCVVFIRFEWSALSSISMSAAFAAGALGRSIQIIREQRLLRKARANPAGTGPVMADPREEHERP